jgi:hypothetical protein
VPCYGEWVTLTLQHDAYLASAIRTSGAQRVYNWVPRLLVQISRLVWTLRRTELSKWH